MKHFAVIDGGPSPTSINLDIPFLPIYLYTVKTGLFALPITNIASAEDKLPTSGKSKIPLFISYTQLPPVKPLGIVCPAPPASVSKLSSV